MKNQDQKKAHVDLRKNSIKFLTCFIRNMLIMPEKLTYEDFHIVGSILSLGKGDVFELVDHWAKTDQAWLEEVNEMVRTIKEATGDEL